MKKVSVRSIIAHTIHLQARQIKHMMQAYCKTQEQLPTNLDKTRNQKTNLVYKWQNDTIKARLASLSTITVTAIDITCYITLDKK